MNKKLDKLFKESKQLKIDDNTKLVIMSDCHRGAGDSFDNFVKNQNIFKAALQYYYITNFTYVELGDGDDMWEVKDCKSIIDSHIDVFKQLKDFHDDGRLIMIYGNHDIEKKSNVILEDCFYKYYNKLTKQTEPLLDGLKVYESLVLSYKGHELFLLHGHQASFLNSNIWRFSRFLVRNLWKTLELFGMNDPTSAAKGYTVRRLVEKRLQKWSNKNNKILISGHTHRAIFPEVGQGLYFNDGSCIHPDGIIALEIEHGNITLVKWEFEVGKERIISVERKVISETESISSYFT